MTKKTTYSNISIPGYGRSLPWMGLTMMMLGLSVLAGFYWEQNSTIRSVQFTGQHFTAEAELTESTFSPVGIHPDSVNYTELIRQISSLPYIREVQARVEANGRMTLNVNERQPVALLLDENRRAYTDSDGVILPIVFNKPVDVPLVYGVEIGHAGDTLRSESFTEIRDFLVAARQHEMGWSTISEVTHTEHEGVVALSHDNGVKLLFGTGNYDEKIHYWETFYTEIVHTSGVQKLGVVDLRFSNQIVTREL